MPNLKKTIMRNTPNYFGNSITKFTAAIRLLTYALVPINPTAMNNLTPAYMFQLKHTQFKVMIKTVVIIVQMVTSFSGWTSWKSFSDIHRHVEL